MNTMRTPVNSGTLFIALILVLLAGRVHADDAATLDPETMKKLAKVGDKVVVDGGDDDNGTIEFDLVIGKTKYPMVAYVGKKGKMQWSIEEHENSAGKKIAALVLRFDRPDRDNPSIMAKKLLPKIKQIPFAVPDKDSGFGGTVYTGNDTGGDEPTDGKVINRFSHDGNNSDKQTGPYFWVTPKYKDGDVEAEGTRGIFISPNPVPATFKSAAIVIGLAEWETPKK